MRKTLSAASNDMHKLAEKHAAVYDGDERQGIKTDVLNAFYKGYTLGQQATRVTLAGSEVTISERASVAPAGAVAVVCNIYGDPEAFAERELRALVDIQTLAIGTRLYAAPTHSNNAAVDRDTVIDEIIQRLGPERPMPSNEWGRGYVQAVSDVISGLESFRNITCADGATPKGGA